MGANDLQIGGDHYQQIEGEQHWDRMWRLYGRGYFVGCATKYIERYHLKNGKADLEKAKHFLQKLIEIEYGEATGGSTGNSEFSGKSLSQTAKDQRTVTGIEYVQT